ncbi:metastasis associated 1-like isoform X3 [Cotesia typhae]|uniref:metastasis associated 1-like isoform X3 n=1 Tax=Cotesia typhae TaxID=2053667 RepID=UPI003D69CE09
MPMPAEYHESHGNHESANFGLAANAAQDASNMTANMYRVGDYVYFETSSTSPYQIRRIEELNKTASGNVEAKVMCFFRRRDLPSTLIMLADKHQLASVEQQRSESPASTQSQKLENPDLTKEMTSKDSGIGHKVMNKGPGKGGWLKAPLSEAHEPHGVEEGVASAGGVAELSTKQRHQMKHRELFLSRQVETMPATHIRGKCCVTLLNETESLLSYLNKEDSFFYCLVFDPAQRTLLADKGEIRVGSRYQADSIVPTVLTSAEKEADPRRLQDLETLVWTPRHSLTDRQIDQFLVVSRSVGTFARALDCSSSVKQPSLHMSAAAASRDITLFHAMDTLHRHNYDIAKAMSSLVPSTGPVLCRDEMEEWSASEANLFEEALDKYGKDFSDIRQDFLPWKTLKNVIEYYYMWKTTDRYVQQKRVKAVEAESKLKQVYIPNYNKTPASTPTGTTILPLGNSNNSNGKGVSVLNGSSNGNITGDNSGILMMGVGGKPCESCQSTQSSQWYAWGPSHMQCRLCQSCWSYWKKYGGLKVPSRIDDSDSDRKRSNAGSDEESKGMSGAHRPHRCSIPSCGKEFKLKAHLSRHYASAHGVDLRGSGAIDGSLLYERVPNKPEVDRLPPTPPQPQPPIQPQQTILKRSRPAFEEINGSDGIALNAGLPGAPPPAKRAHHSQQLHPKHVLEHTPQTIVPLAPPLNGRAMHPHTFPHGVAISRSNARKQVMTWSDAPDDVYFRATDLTKRQRRSLSSVELRRAARKPWRKLSVPVYPQRAPTTRNDDSRMVVILD